MKERCRNVETCCISKKLLKETYSKLYNNPVCYNDFPDVIIYRSALKDLMNELELLK